MSREAFVCHDLGRSPSRVPPFGAVTGGGSAQDRQERTGAFLRDGAARSPCAAHLLWIRGVGGVGLALAKKDTACNAFISSRSGKNM